MSVQSKSDRIRMLNPREISPNPENPRIIFRQDEMETLLLSIEKYGVQVPVNVYEHKGKYFLIDGERRWRCSLKLNLPSIPALIRPKPSALQNLLLMSNIHALREQWDYFTIAQNLSRIIDLFKRERGIVPNETQLSEETGLTRGQIRRCQLLMELPDKYKNLLLEELKLPKSQQKLSEDLFIEMERSLKTVTNRLPEIAPKLEAARDALIYKFRAGTIENITDFRQISKIATAIENIGIRKVRAINALDRLFDKRSPEGIKEIYEATVEFGYDEKKAINQVDSLNEFLDHLSEDSKVSQLDESLRSKLKHLYHKLNRLLKDFNALDE